MNCFNELKMANTKISKIDWHYTPKTGSGMDVGFKIERFLGEKEAFLVRSIGYTYKSFLYQDSESYNSAIELSYKNRGLTLSVHAGSQEKNRPVLEEILNGAGIDVPGDEVQVSQIDLRH